MAVASSRSGIVDFQEALDSRSSAMNGGELKELQAEIDSIRRSLADLDAHSLLQKLRKVQEQSSNQMEAFDESELDFSALRAEFIDLTTKHKFLSDLAQGKYEADASGEHFSSLQKEVADLKESNSSTITEIEGLIRTILNDARAMETLLGSTQGCLDSCELKLQELGSQCKENTPGECEEARFDQELDMLTDTISQNRFEELSLKRQIDEKAKELEELEKLAKIHESYIQDNTILEALKGVSVLSMSSGRICLQLKTHLSEMSLEDFKNETSKSVELVVHKLDIIVEPSKLSILQAELTPKNVDISDIVSAVQESGGIGGDFFEKLAFLVKEAQVAIRSRCKSSSASGHR